VLERFRDIIRDYRITSFDEAGASFRLRAVVVFVDNSQLHIRETLIGGTTRKYAYHWQTSDNLLLVRWDNAPDWDVETFPHHKHVGEQQRVEPSYERSLEQVLVVIAQRLDTKSS
jgi:hypothetical protein